MIAHCADLSAGPFLRPTGAASVRGTRLYPIPVAPRLHPVGRFRRRSTDKSCGRSNAYAYGAYSLQIEHVEVKR
jgi:hypothetical protein